MKKLVLFLVLSLGIYGCGISIDLGGEDDPVVEPEVLDVTEDVEIAEEVVEEVPVEDDVTYNGPNFITINSPQTDDVIHEEPIIFTGVVSPNVTKLEIKAVGGPGGLGGSEGYTDNYMLQDFKYGDDKFSYRASQDFHNLMYGTNNYTFKAYYEDGSTKTSVVSIFFTDGTAEMGKPVVYLYPEETSEIFVNVEPVDGISVSDPEIGKGWSVIATPDGELLNLADYKVYPYLFWEGFAGDFVTPEEGFVVEKDAVAKFFDEKLGYMGLNAREIADFKEYWVERLSDDNYYFITFMPQDDFEKYAPLTVKPEPDTVIRVFFDYKGLDEKVEVKEQKLEQRMREGFTVIEWGGRLY
ncbi:hypothetical protein KJ632_01585 [Patescibacteria group bacterium]|nr:hypothetical protein [Patescibacteria group bacterium]